MRTPQEILSMVLKIAQEDERIRAVTMGGSRANKNCPEDIYQDFDIVFHVKDCLLYTSEMLWMKWMRILFQNI